MAYVVGVLGISINVAIWTIVNEIRKSMDAVIPYFKIDNAAFRELGAQKLEDLRNLLVDLEGDTVSLNVIDLFKFSKLQTQTARNIIAVDVKSENLTFSEQLNDYLSTSKKAARSGVRIDRIIVFPDKFRCLVEELNGNEIVSKDAHEAASVIIRYIECGSRNLDVVFRGDLDDPTYPLDFAVFDEKLVLHDPYTFVGRQSMVGYVSIASSTIEEYQNRFDFLSQAASKNRHVVERLSEVATP